MLTFGQERYPLIEINGDIKIKAVTFTANGDYIVGGGGGQVGVWSVEDGKQMTLMAARDVRSLAVSQDGRWIAAGTDMGEVFVYAYLANQRMWNFHALIYFVNNSGARSS